MPRLVQQHPGHQPERRHSTPPSLGVPATPSTPTAKSAGPAYTPEALAALVNATTQGGASGVEPVHLVDSHGQSIHQSIQLSGSMGGAALTAGTLNPKTAAALQAAGTSNGAANGGAWNGTNQRQYPEMLKVSNAKPPLKSLGATGTAIFSGIITSEEYNPDFYWRDAILIYEQMIRNDAQVFAAVQMLELPIRRATWSIEPATDSLVDKEIASFVETCLFHDLRYRTASGRWLTQKWDDLLRHILMMFRFGFMPFEVNWRVDPGGWVKWSRFTPLLPRTIYRWWVGEDNELAGVQQWTYKNYSYVYVDIPADKLLLFVHRQEGNNYEGVSVLRSAYKNWYYKDNFYRIEAVAIERNAISVPVIGLPDNFTDSDIAQAQKITANLRANENLGVTLPPGWTFEYAKNQQKYAAGTAEPIAHHDVMIARNILAQFINLGSTETGAFALDASQKATFLAALQAQAEYIEDVFNSDAIPRLVDYNYAGVSVYPRLKCSKVLAMDYDQLANALNKLSANLPKPYITPDPELEDFLRNELGLPSAPASVIQSYNPSGMSAAGQQEPGAGDPGTASDGPQAGQNGLPSENDTGDDGGAGDGGAGGALREPQSARTVKLFNPYHDDKGRFTTGGTGGEHGEGGGRHVSVAVEHRPNTTVHYHVVNGDWQSGESLRGRSELVDEGRARAWKWGGDAPEGFDGHGVSLFKTAAEAEDFRDTYGGHIVRVHVPDGFIAHDADAGYEARAEYDGSAQEPPYGTPYFARNSEGYAFVHSFVPGSWITDDYQASRNTTEDEGSSARKTSALSEGISEVRLLRESLDAVMGLDAVSRGERSGEAHSLKLFNPNHDARGRFAPGGAGGRVAVADHGQPNGEHGAERGADHASVGHLAALEAAHEHATREYFRLLGEHRQAARATATAFKALGDDREGLATHTAREDGPHGDYQRALAHMKDLEEQVKAAGQTQARAWGALDRARGGTGVEIERAGDDQAAMRHVFGRALSDHELVAMTGARLGDRLHVQGLTTAADGQHLRLYVQGAQTQHTLRITRAGNDVVAHDEYLANKATHGAESGHDLVAGMEGMRAAGVTEVRATAAREQGLNGYDTWAKLGFTGELPEGVRQAAQARFGPHVRRVEDVLAQPGGRAWWKANGASYQARFSFRPGSPSMARYEALKARLQAHHKLSEGDGDLDFLAVLLLVEDEEEAGYRLAEGLDADAEGSILLGGGHAPGYEQNRKSNGQFDVGDGPQKAQSPEERKAAANKARAAKAAATRAANKAEKARAEAERGAERTVERMHAGTREGARAAKSAAERADLDRMEARARFGTPRIEQTTAEYAAREATLASLRIEGATALGRVSEARVRATAASHAYDEAAAAYKPHREALDEARRAAQVDLAQRGNPEMAAKLANAQAAEARAAQARDAARNGLNEARGVRAEVENRLRAQGLSTREIEQHREYRAADLAARRADDEHTTAMGNYQWARENLARQSYYASQPSDEQVRAHPLVQAVLPAHDAASARLTTASEDLRTARKALNDATAQLPRIEAAMNRAYGGQGHLITDMTEDAVGGQTAHDALRSIFGRDLSNDEIGGLVGAQPGDHVHIANGGSPDAPFVHLSLHARDYDPTREDSFYNRQSAYNAHRELFVEVEGDRVDPSARQQIVMNNDNFRAEPHSGNGTRVFADQVENLNRLGVSEIRTEAVRDDANGLNGYNTWARLGYDAPLNVRELVNHPEGRTFTRADLPESVRGAKTISDLMKTPEGRDFWRQHGYTFDGVFKLGPRSKSLAHLRTYVAARKAKGTLSERGRRKGHEAWKSQTSYTSGKSDGGSGTRKDGKTRPARRTSTTISLTDSGMSAARTTARATTPRAQETEESIKLFNPYHDTRGRFTTGGLGGEHGEGLGHEHGATGAGGVHGSGAHRGAEAHHTGAGGGGGGSTGGQHAERPGERWEAQRQQAHEDLRQAKQDHEDAYRRLMHAQAEAGAAEVDRGHAMDRLHDARQALRANPHDAGVKAEHDRRVREAALAGMKRDATADAATQAQREHADAGQHVADAQRMVYASERAVRTGEDPRALFAHMDLHGQVMPFSDHEAFEAWNRGQDNTGPSHTPGHGWTMTESKTAEIPDGSGRTYFLKRNEEVPGAQGQVIASSEDQARNESATVAGMKALGMGDLVPREAYHLIGSDGLHYSVISAEPGESVDKAAFDRASMGKLLDGVRGADLERLTIGQYLMGVKDRHAGNLLYDEQTGGIKAIDFGLGLRENAHMDQSGYDRNLLLRQAAKDAGRNYMQPREINAMTRSVHFDPGMVHAALGHEDEVLRVLADHGASRRAQSAAKGRFALLRGLAAQHPAGVSVQDLLNATGTAPF